MDNPDNSFSIAEYIIRYLSDELTPAQREQLSAWLKKDKKNQALFEQLKDKYFIQQELKTFESFDARGALKKFKDSITIQKPVIRLKPFYRKWWMAAAAILIVAASLSYVFITQNNTHVATPIAEKEANKQDVMPGGNKAVLTLSDGTKIVLDSVQNGMLTQQGNAKVVKLQDGKISYEQSAIRNQQSIINFNTISTPRGGRYQLALADGSLVWLNSQSSITFPTSFSGHEREVTITGEAYFEVARNREMPFHVKVGDMDVQVLGTHFNINAYDDEDVMKTTLIEGSVRVTKGSNSVLIKPGEQATVARLSGSISVIKRADVESVIAWKNGKFIFQGENIREIMKELSRWYDVNPDYKLPVTEEKFVGVISRNVNLSQILSMLEKTGVVKFKIVGKNVMVE